MITEYLHERIDAGDFPSAVYLIAEKGDIVAHQAVGHAVIRPRRIEARPDTIYDLASLTKVLVTGILLAKLLEEERLELGTRLEDVLKGRELAGLSRLTVRNLVTHTSGLAGWLPFYLLVGE